MDYGNPKSYQLYAAPQMLVQLQPQPQLQPPPPQAPAGHLYYYSTPNPNNSSSSLVFAGQAMRIPSGVYAQELAPADHIKNLNLEEKKKKMIHAGGASADRIKICTICNIVCNSQQTFDAHNMGRKHKSRTLKLKEQMSTEPSTATLKEDLKAKKDKVIRGGATEEAILICSLCDVVCNSKDVYNSHITGKKHHAKKLKLVP